MELLDTHIFVIWNCQIHFSFTYLFFFSFECFSELETLEVPGSQSCTQTQETDFSDIEISESETDDIDDESERRPLRKSNKFGKVNEKGETPLHQAAIAGNAKKVILALILKFKNTLFY